MSHNDTHTVHDQRMKPKVGGGKQLLIWLSTILLFVLAFLGWMSLVGAAYLWASEQFGNSSGWDAVDIAHLVLVILGVIGAAVGTIMVGRAWAKALKYNVLRSIT